MSIGRSSRCARLPEVSISKIRFLETEGLIEPERTPSGYRKFSHRDVERLRYVLTSQREHYLPLKVIKEHLDAIDRGLEPPAASGTGPQVPVVLAGDGYPSADSFSAEPSELRLSRAELVSGAEIDDAFLEQLEMFGLVKPRPGTSHYDGEALVIAKTAGSSPRSASSPATCVPSRPPRTARSVSSSRWSRRCSAAATPGPRPARRRPSSRWRPCRSGCTRRLSRAVCAPHADPRRAFPPGVLVESCAKLM